MVIMFDICKTVIGRSTAERNDFADKSLCNGRKMFNITINDQGTILWEQLGKFSERIADIIQILEEIKMVSIYI